MAITGKMLLVQLQLVDIPDVIPTDFNENEEVHIVGVPEGMAVDADAALALGSPLYESICSVLMGMKRELTEIPVRLIAVRF
ncbi:MAG: hypothetical protein AAB758_00680 [Patescibacteria group bacterium]|mgnify:CR=1 FL=1